MQGLSLKSIKHHPSLIPLFFVALWGSSVATFFTVRSALKNPDVSWNRKKNPEPWNEYKDKRFQFFNPGEGRGHQQERLKSLWD